MMEVRWQSIGIMVLIALGLTVFSEISLSTLRESQWTNYIHTWNTEVDTKKKMSATKRVKTGHIEVCKTK